MRFAIGRSGWAACAALALLAAAGAARAVTITSAGTTRFYDEQVAVSNAIDVDTGGLQQFTREVAEAWGEDKGGVIDWDTGVAATESSSQNANNNILPGGQVTVSFGTNATKQLVLTFSAEMRLCTRTGYYASSALSGGKTPGRALYKDQNYLYTYTGSPLTITFSGSGATIGEVGLGVLGVGGYTMALTANLSGGGAVALTNAIAGDTFFHLVAPERETIVSLTLRNLTNASRMAFDDLGFIFPRPPRLRGPLLIIR